MDQRDYETALRPMLEEHSDVARARLERFVDAATAPGGAGGGVDAIVINVFVDQDGEGPFDVWARFEGRDGFALDRRFDDERELFGVVWGEQGWEPEVPDRPAGWTRDDLEDAVVAAVAAWLRPLIPAEASDVSWRIESPDGAVVADSI
ncbi:DUF6389 family protein [Leucobacter aridicollis]|uniref:Uncharacterized protein n=1 Tax=Leucobacter aridicollis TaxID=283878 RepID=A0A852R9Y7_9MICO|nr:DUF6389 family protein [Leucobacter aridicollis]MBL3681316.1 hypothetical protein [Leucobacter aridicollis]NYD27658.1 hypothetical protein [Leucobacter aridicollis]